MELMTELLLPNQTQSPYYGYLALYMSGKAPQDSAALKAAVDVYDIQDAYNKCVGFATLSQPACSGAEATVQQCPDRVALKGSPINYFIKYSLPAPELQFGAPPDRITICNGADPYAPAEKLGMAGISRMHLMPWAGLDGMATDIPRCLGVANGVRAIAMVWEWDVERTFGGILRAATDSVMQPAPHTVAVDAWVGGAWKQVLAPSTRPLSSPQIHQTFEQVTTSKLRLRWSTDTGYANSAHGIIPLEVTISTPAPKDVPKIEWALLLPLGLYNVSGLNALLDLKSAPLPMLVAAVGAELILSKSDGLKSNEMPTITALKLTALSAKG